MYNCKTLVLLAMICLMVASCTKKQENREFYDDYPHEVDYDIYKEGHDSDDPPIIITHLTDIQGNPVNGATVEFIINSDTSSGLSYNPGICTLGVGMFGIGDLSVYKEAYQDVFIQGVILTDSLTDIVITMYGS